MAGKLATAAQAPAPIQELSIWPENVEAVNFFVEFCSTQWRVSGMGGETGLDYTAVLACIREQRLKRDKSEQLFEDIRTMERGALKAMHSK